MWLKAPPHHRHIKPTLLQRPFVFLFLIISVLLANVALLPPSPVQAVTLPADFIETQITTGLTAPTSFEFAPDGRVFITQQTGTVRIVKNGVLLPTPFLSIMVNSAG